ncbi:MAG: hypothetical protein ACTMIL_10465 [Brevibacterium aurantiacum]
MSEKSELAVTRILEGNLGVHMNGRSLPGEGPHIDLISPMTGTALGSLAVLTGEVDRGSHWSRP